MLTSCPRCGSPARLLFNLVCINTECRNYDNSWQKEWFSNHKPNYNHIVGNFGVNHRFLGNFTSNGGIQFDLYTCGLPGELGSSFSDGLCLARCGDSNSDCYYVDNKETEIGTIASGPVDSIDQSVKEALLEALRRFRGK